MYFAQLLDPAKHQLNQDLSAVLIWYIPILILVLFLVLGPVLQRVNIRRTNLRTLVGVLLLVIGGFVSAGLAGLMTIGFGLCFGSDCSTQIGVAIGLVPALLSLIFTVPIAIDLIKRSSQTSERPRNNKFLIVLGLIIMIWSSVVYIPRLVSAVTDYRSVKTSK